MLESKQKGIVTELQCITYFNKLGYQVSIPYGENARYDFIVDVEGHLIRVQVKTSKENNNGTITISCKSTRPNTKGVVTKYYTSDEIDYFATFYNDKCYLIPVEECHCAKILRFRKAANNQSANIYLAEDYEAEVQVKKILSN